MKTYRYIIFTLGVIVLGLGFFGLTSDKSSGQFQNVDSLDGNKITDFTQGNLSNLLPLNQVGECSDSQYPNCYTNTYSDYGLTAYALVAFEDMPELKFEDNTFLVPSDAELNYECDGVEAFRTKWRDNWQVEYSKGDISSEYPSIDTEGSIDLSNYEGDEGVMIICGDWIVGSDGAWVATSIAGGYTQGIELNKKPVINSVEQPTKVFDDKSAEFSVDVSDPNSIQNIDDLDISWSNGESGQEADYDFSDTGQKTVSVQVSDGEFVVSKSVEVSVLSGNEPPVIESLNVPNSVEAGQRFNVSVDAVDADGDDLSYSWSNGDSGSSASYRFLEPGNYSVGVTVSDGELEVDKFSIVNVVEDESDGTAFFSELLDFFGSFF